MLKYRKGRVSVFNTNGSRGPEKQRDALVRVDFK